MAIPEMLIKSVFLIKNTIAIPENNAKNSAPQSVNYCVTDFRRTPVLLQICSLQFALCSTAFFSLFSGLAIVACVCSLTEDGEKWERIFWGLIALYWFIRSEVV